MSRRARKRAEAPPDERAPARDSGSVGDPRRRRRIGLGIAFLVSASLVVGAFNPAPHSGGDNAAYVTLAYSLLQGEYTDLYDPAGLPHTKYPPVFPALLALLVGLGARTWTTLKLVPAIATVAAVGFTYLWAERRLGPLAGLGVAVALAVSSAVVYYSHWILSDPLFLAWTMAALWLLERGEGSDATGDELQVPRRARLLLAAGVVAVGLAYFTRSAGLPLVVALLVWLGVRRRWKTLAAAGLALGVPGLLWFVRGLGEGVGEYGSEFWLVDPYDPSLGAVGLAGLAGRFGTNLGGYLTQWGPGGILGTSGGATGLFGVALTGLALYGWLLSARRRLGPAELFLPLYAGLILLWPEVWSGDRFALPLYPLFFLYAVVALRSLGDRVGDAGRSALVAVALLVVLLPAGRSWLRASQEASACSAVIEAQGPWACYGPGIGDFVAAAAWLGAAAPEGTVVLSRKPRIFYVLSGVPSRVFPFSDDPAVLLTVADELGARLVVLDRWDGLASRYVGPAIERWPQAFCAVMPFESGPTPTYVLAFKPPAQRGSAAAGSGGEVRLDGCEPGLVAAIDREVGYASSRSKRIPLLERLDP